MSVEVVGYICYICYMYDVITQASGKLNLFIIHSATANHTFFSKFVQTQQMLSQRI